MFQRNFGEIKDIETITMTTACGIFRPSFTLLAEVCKLHFISGIVGDCRSPLNCLAFPPQQDAGHVE